MTLTREQLNKLKEMGYVTHTDITADILETMDTVELAKIWKYIN